MNLSTFALGLILAWAAPVAAEEISGPAEVTDGDSLTIAGSRIRLFGIDAPEGKQTCQRLGVAWACGEAATRELASLLERQTVRCRSLGADDYGRTLAVCRVGALELNRTMVEYGWAIAFRRYSQDYVAAETLAQAKKLGIWSSDFMTPSNFRAAQTQRAAAAHGQSAPTVKPRLAVAGNGHNQGCLIKGNRNRRGQWIYHLPGMPY